METVELKFHEGHTWVRQEGQELVIGVTDFAQEQLGDVVFIELPEVGAMIEAEDPFGSIESPKAVEDLIAPVSGEVIRRNDEVVDNPETVNDDAYGEGWLIAVKMTDETDLGRSLIGRLMRLCPTDEVSMSQPKHWRLLDSGPADGAWNMAVDEAMLEAGVAGLLVPTLRFYAWQPAGVSLGYFQPLDASISLEEIARRGFGLVRRPSGGRAILHKSVMGSYRSISRGIEAGLGLLGVGAQLAERKGEERMKAQGLPTVCFAKAAKCDMTVQGRKIVGSAQTRRRGIIMQHGSVPIHIDPEEHLAVMPGDGVDEASKAKLMEAACGVADALGQPVSYEELAAALAQGFAERLGLILEPGELTEWELAKARELKETKYTTDEWNRKPGKRQG